MPRVVKESRRASGGARNPSGSVATTFKAGLKIPLNDDAQEKAKRAQSRQAAHEDQMKQIKAAASPMRKLNEYQRADSESPNSHDKTPRGVTPRRGTTPRGVTPGGLPANDLENGIMIVGGNAVTPMKRVPLLANFEEWMKMATDNKINATNSWNFALIDYFHDMTLLKEGDGVNFQKASCTLDGCVKIYTSRVDSVATETGKLLSGLADSNSNKKKRGTGDGAEGDESEEEVEDENGEVVKKPKKKTRSSEATLAPSFDPLRLKKFELEFSVDPLFKKASADFDEGGAKGLLLNHLAIDAHGRIVFDSSDDAGDASTEGHATRRKEDVVEENEDEEPLEQTLEKEEQDEENDEEDVEIDVATLGAKFFPNLDRLEEQDICPSLKNFDLGDAFGSSDIPFLKAPEDWRQEKDKAAQSGDDHDQTGIFLDDDNPMGFDDDDDGLLGNFDMADGAGFGEGGEVWAKEAAIEPQLRTYTVGDGLDGEDGDGMGAGTFDPESGEFVVSHGHGEKTEGGHEDIMSYFDQALQKNWAGPEHWRIRKIKDINKPATTTKARKEKELFEIDFLPPLDQALADIIYTHASTNAAISMPRKDWKSKTRNLLPDDKHFNSKQLLRLFLKPKARMGSKRAVHGGRFGGLQPAKKEEDIPEGEMDEAYWARKEDHVNADNDEAPQGDYDANFFQDDVPGVGMDDEDDMEFADARDHFSPGAENGGGGGLAGINNVLDIVGTQGTGLEAAAFGTQLVTSSRRMRPEYVQYARVAKKVDVRRLKEEIWRGMGIQDLIAPPAGTMTPPPSQTPVLHPKKNEDGSLKFTSVMQNLQAVYPKQVMNDISTSYCFICLLHLANDKGLVIENQEGFTDLSIKVDETAVITVGGD